MVRQKDVGAFKKKEKRKAHIGVRVSVDLLFMRLYPKIIMDCNLSVSETV